MIFNYEYTDRMRPYLKQRNEKVIESNAKIDLILFGDSIFQSYDINRYFPMSKKVINSAIGGDRLQFMVQRFEEDVLNLKPNEVIFLGGINNIRAWQNENRKLEEISEIVKTIVEGYSEIIKMAHKNRITIYPVLITKNQEEKHNHIFINEVINQVNNELLTLERELSVKFIDFNKVLCNENGAISLDLAPDGLHPNELGYMKITDMLIENGIVR